MIIGLRERFHLEKFVSKQTVDYVQRASEMGVKLGGERKVATVFFSDVRGFTAFSEKVEPERVVGMLNSILSRQAAIVKKYDGDIDKYVGDELVAVFQGEQMVKNAVRMLH
jgi:adenylate cyclase